MSRAERKTKSSQILVSLQFPLRRSIATDPLVYLLVLYEMRLLPKSLRADLAAEGLLARVRPQVHLDVALVEEASVADRAPVDRLLLAQQPAEVGRRLVAVSRHVRLVLYLLLHLLVVTVGPAARRHAQVRL